jgi:hypothetical protein
MPITVDGNISAQEYAGATGSEALDGIEDLIQAGNSLRDGVTKNAAAEFLKNLLDAKDMSSAMAAKNKLVEAFNAGFKTMSDKPDKLDASLQSIVDAKFPPG